MNAEDKREVCLYPLIAAGVVFLVACLIFVLTAVFGG